MAPDIAGRTDFLRAPFSFLGHDYGMEFDRLRELPGTTHRFLLRYPEVNVDGDRDEVLRRLWPSHSEEIERLGFSPGSLHLAEQVHGAGVAIINNAAAAGGPVPDVDGMVSNRRGVLLGIYVADCCAVYLADPVSGAIGLVHSGKKGSELGITGIAIQKMQEHFGAKVEDIRVQLSPCIRPPAYEVDFAAQIRTQALELGVRPEHLWDEGICTSRELQSFYSYRTEKGRTGRMLALLGRL